MAIQIPYDSALDKLVVGNRGSNGLVLFENCCEESSSSESSSSESSSIESSEELSSFEPPICENLLQVPRYLIIKKTADIQSTVYDWSSIWGDLRLEYEQAWLNLWNDTYVVRNSAACQYYKRLSDNAFKTYTCSSPPTMINDVSLNVDISQFRIDVNGSDVYVLRGTNYTEPSTYKITASSSSPADVTDALETLLSNPSAYLETTTLHTAFYTPATQEYWPYSVCGVNPAPKWPTYNVHNILLGAIW